MDIGEEKDNVEEEVETRLDAVEREAESDSRSDAEREMEERLTR